MITGTTTTGPTMVDVYPANASTNSSRAPSNPDNVGLHLFETMVITVGVTGAVANGVTFIVFILSTQILNNDTKMLILNQIIHDFLSGVCLTVAYSMKLAGYVYMNNLGMVVCVLLGSETLIYSFFLNSTASLVAIALERYLKIVRWGVSRGSYPSGITTFMIIFTWILGPICCCFPLVAITTKVIDGTCVPFAFWPYRWMQATYGVFVFVCSFILPISVLSYCYWEVIKTIRHHRQVLRHLTNQSSVLQQKRTFVQQVDIVHTLVAMVAVCFVCWTPNQIYFLLLNLIELPIFTSTRYFTVFLQFSTVCLNPFIYAARLEQVKSQERSNDFDLD